ncbi:MAG TPA: hypothetical protein VLH79_01690 [Chthonomonadales bacterium]|nr:hypothetical protein [Chthonomonadales bacterium]
MVWGYLMHLGLNMWSDREAPDGGNPYLCARPYLRFDTGLYQELLPRMRDAGLNLLVVEIGEGVRYESRPEIAVEGSWSTSRLREELERIRSFGLEPIPKLNFSACHDAWLGPYARMVSTPAYYDAVRDLISETIALFGAPRWFHLGMDEETAAHQAGHEYVVVRQHELWWNDLSFLTGCVEAGGARPWVWSDVVWHHPDLFFERMPRGVLQSNWYYGESFELGGAAPDDPYRDADAPRAYVDLEQRGYDQVPTGSNWSVDTNFGRTVAFCRERIAPERLLGFLMAPWRPTMPEFRPLHEAAIAQVAEARARW